MPPARGWHALALAALALVVYFALAQNRLYGDGAQIVVWSRTGQRFHTVHLLYLPLLDQWTAWFEAAGMRFYDAARLLSAAATAVAVALAYSGARLLEVDRRRALWTASLVASAPAVVFFATVVEVHAVFLAFAAAAFVATAWVVRRPTLPRGALLGVATGLGFTAHSSGSLLPLPLVMLAAVELRQRDVAWRRMVAVFLTTAVVHLAIVGLAPVVVVELGGVGIQSTAGFIADYTAGKPVDWPALPVALWNEWLWAFAPLSLVVLGGLRGSQRRATVALFLAWLPYMAAAFLILGSLNEHGAYLIPLVIPAACVVGRGLPEVVSVATVVLASVLAVTTVCEHDSTGDSRALAQGVQRALDGQPTRLMVGTAEGLQASLAYLDDSEFLWLGTFMTLPQAALPNLEATLQALVRKDADAGRAVVLCGRAERLLRQLADAGDPIATGLVRHFRDDYDVVELRSGVFSGVQLRPR